MVAQSRLHAISPTGDPQDVVAVEVSPDRGEGVSEPPVEAAVLCWDFKTPRSVDNALLKLGVDEPLVANRQLPAKQSLLLDRGQRFEVISTYFPG